MSWRNGCALRLCISGKRACGESCLQLYTGRCIWGLPSSGKENFLSQYHYVMYVSVIYCKLRKRRRNWCKNYKIYVRLAVWSGHQPFSFSIKQTQHNTQPVIWATHLQAPVKIPFAECSTLFNLSQVYVRHYYYRCINDYCLALSTSSYTGDELNAVICSALGAYCLECTLNGIGLDFRTESLCRKLWRTLVLLKLLSWPCINRLMVLPNSHRECWQQF